MYEGNSSDPRLLTLNGVSRSFGERVVLAPVDVAVGASECVALMGPNGSGKSTLLRIATDQDRPTSGDVTFAGSPLRGDAIRARARIAASGDGVSYYPDLTVREHLELVATAHGAGKHTDAWVAGALSECRLDDRADAVPTALSSGQVQALQLAAMLVRPRELMVLDEPEQRLDPEARQRLAQLLLREKAAGTGIVLATHHLELARAVADRVVVLQDGQVTADGAPATVFADSGGSWSEEPW